MAASKSAADKLKADRNPFKGMTMAQMKKKYSAMTPAQRAANVETFRAAAKVAPKPKKAPVPKGGSKPRQTTPAEAKARFFSSSSQGSVQQNQDKAKARFFQGSRGGAPKRSDFGAGRAGQASYAAAKRRYEKGDTPTRRGRLSAAERRRARRSSR